ncbi:MAG: hypothetical protein FD127_226 [Acidimicrobiaceae bacterium]|nr:MAG: hypothetical protein FD127_226 [Acidimicrobiaceae bacterium]
MHINREVVRKRRSGSADDDNVRHGRRGAPVHRPVRWASARYSGLARTWSSRSPTPSSAAQRVMYSRSNDSPCTATMPRASSTWRDEPERTAHSNFVSNTSSAVATMTDTPDTSSGLRLAKSTTLNGRVSRTIKSTFHTCRRVARSVDGHPDASYPIEHRSHPTTSPHRRLQPLLRRSTRSGGGPQLDQHVAGNDTRLAIVDSGVEPLHQRRHISLGHFLGVFLRRSMPPRAASRPRPRTQ